MVKLRFYWDGYATFEDEDEYNEMELVENFEGDSWKECWAGSASCSLDWDDDELVTCKSDCTETSREFERIEICDEKGPSDCLVTTEIAVTINYYSILRIRSLFLPDTYRFVPTVVIPVGL